jgi:hypothetical protein
MKRTIALALGLGLLAACGSNANPIHGTEVDAPPGSVDASPSASQLTVFTIVLENHDYGEIVGSSNAPYINSLIAQGALATNYKDTNHPSLPNYLHMISGDDQYFGVVDLDPTTPLLFPVDANNLATQLETANIAWRSYQESMGTPCQLSGSGNYAPKHDPFLYFKDQQKGANGLCADTNVDYSKFADDLASNQYRYMWITPNLLDDGHDPQTDPVTGLKDTDGWMSTEVPRILNSDAFKAGGILFITWDEAENRTDKDRIPMIIVSSRVKQPGMTSATALDHGSYLATVEDLFGLPRLPTVASTTSLMEFLNP